MKVRLIVMIKRLTFDNRRRVSISRSRSVLKIRSGFVVFRVPNKFETFINSMTLNTTVSALGDLTSSFVVVVIRIVIKSLISKFGIESRVLGLDIGTRGLVRPFILIRFLTRH